MGRTCGASFEVVTGNLVEEAIGVPFEFFNGVIIQGFKMYKYYIMAKSRKYRKNIIKKKVNTTMRGGVHGDSNSLSNITSSGLSGMSDADSLSAITTVLSKAKLGCNSLTLTGVKKAAIASISLLDIPTEFDKQLQTLLGTKATMSDLFIDCIKALKCDDIDIFIEILPKVFVIDKIGKLLDTPNLSSITEAAKEGLPLFKEMRDIIATEKFQNFMCRILNEMVSNKHILSEYKEKFIAFYVGTEKAKQICESESNSPNGSISKMSSSFMSNISSMGSSVVGSKQGNSEKSEKSEKAEKSEKSEKTEKAEPDTRCGENLLVKTSWFSGDYCVPKVNTEQIQSTTTPAENPQAAQAAQEEKKGGKRYKYKRVKNTKKSKK